MSANRLMSSQSSGNAGGLPWPRPEDRPGRGGRDEGSDDGLTSLLGWFSVGLGLASLAAPRGVARLIGARGDQIDESVIRMVGLQELTCGLGILSGRRPTGWVWARVAGDAVHLTMLSTAMASGPPRPDRMAAATAAIVGITAVDAYEALRLSRSADSGPDGDLPAAAVNVHQTITISRPAEELYRFWRDFRNLPRVMSHLQSVETDEASGRSHWKANGPAGTTVEWDAEVTDDRPNQFIAWRSVGGRVSNAGSVRFVPAPGGRGTEVHVEFRYDPPGGAVGRWAAKLFGEEPEQQAYDALRHFKQVMETGQIVKSDGSFDGTRITQRPAQPPAALSGR